MLPPGARGKPGDEAWLFLLPLHFSTRLAQYLIINSNCKKTAPIGLLTGCIYGKLGCRDTNQGLNIWGRRSSHVKAIQSCGSLFFKSDRHTSRLPRAMTSMPEGRYCGDERILPHTGELCPDPGDLIGEKTIDTNKERDDRKQHAW